MLDGTDRKTVEPIVVVLRIHASRVEVQVPPVGCGVERRRPIVAVRATVVPRRAIAVAGAREEENLFRSLPDTIRRGIDICSKEFIESFVFLAQRMA